MVGAAESQAKPGIGNKPFQGRPRVHGPEPYGCTGRPNQRILLGLAHVEQVLR